VVAATEVVTETTDRVAAVTVVVATAVVIARAAATARVVTAAAVAATAATATTVATTVVTRCGVLSPQTSHGRRQDWQRKDKRNDQGIGTK
jgi:fatty acid desaturase